MKRENWELSGSNNKPSVFDFQNAHLFHLYMYIVHSRQNKTTQEVGEIKACPLFSKI